MKRDLSKKILLTGLLIGTLDIIAACVDYYITTGKGSSGVIKYIASGVFGKQAFTGNAEMIAAGLLFHYLFAIGFAFLFFLFYSRITLLSKSRILTAIVYGALIWVFMNLVVIQLSNAPHGPISAINPLKALRAMLILICMIGLPLSFIAYHHFKNRKDDVVLK